MTKDCPNQRKVLLTHDGYATVSSISNESESEKSDEEHQDDDPIICEPPLGGVNILTQKVQSEETKTKGQRWSLFQTECTIKEKACKLIIDGGSYTNAISKDLVHALGLSAWRHPKLNYMEWLYNSGRLKITHKVCVSSAIGSCINKVDCDVVPMDACHLLLGRP